MQASKQIHFQTLKFSLYFVPFSFLFRSILHSSRSLCFAYGAITSAVAVRQCVLCVHRIHFASGWTKGVNLNTHVALIINVVAFVSVWLFFSLAWKESTRCAPNNQNESHKEKKKKKPKCLRVGLESLVRAMHWCEVRWGEGLEKKKEVQGRHRHAKLFRERASQMGI